MEEALLDDGDRDLVSELRIVPLGAALDDTDAVADDGDTERSDDDGGPADERGGEFEAEAAEEGEHEESIVNAAADERGDEPERDQHDPSDRDRRSEDASPTNAEASTASTDPVTDAAADEAGDGADDADRSRAEQTEGDEVAAAAPSARAEQPLPSDDDAPPLSDPAEISAVAFSVLSTQRDGLPRARLADVCHCKPAELDAGLEHLARKLADAGLPLELARAGDLVRLMTAPVVFPYLRRLRQTKSSERISPAALETLAVVAYRQPVIRAEIESIRGVKAGPVLRWLLEHKLIDVVGRADVPGRPLQYGTTRTFLERFGLASLEDLPSVREFRTLQ